MKNIFITGATSGIGLVAACELAAQGNKVMALARSVDKGNVLLDRFKSKYPQGKGSIEIVLGDLSSFESVVKACDVVKSKIDCLDVIINNAGIWNFSYKESSNKIEEIFHVNVLAPLLINDLLLELLLKSKEAKSIFAASALHQGEVDFSNLEFKKKFSGFRAYRQSKLEVILLTRLLAKKLENFNVGVYCEHPGLVNTKLGRDANWFSNLFFRLFGMSPEKGAETIIFLAQEDKRNLISGEYYAKKKVKKITEQSYDMKVAAELLLAIKSYLLRYVNTSSVIFQ
jgi:NAD(P)-dependent dehydrogenase (short-subunit alcohol dehydrogenase family)